MHAATERFEIWLKGLFAAGLAAMGIDPQHFDLQTGIGQVYLLRGSEQPEDPIHYKNENITAVGPRAEPRWRD